MRTHRHRSAFALPAILSWLVIPLSLAAGSPETARDAAPPTGQNLLYVDISEQDAGKTYLAIRSLDGSGSVRITPAMFQIVGPVSSETTGTIGFTHLTRMMKAEVYILRPDGRPPVRLMEGSSLDGFSPDGKSLLITSSGRAPALSIYDLALGTSRKISGNLLVTSAAWSPLQDRVALTALTSAGTNDLYMIDPAAGTSRRLTETPSVDEFTPFFSRDGKTLGFTSRSGEDWRITYIDLASGQRTASTVPGQSPALSPDGEWILTESDGEMLLHGRGGQGRRSLGTGRSPAWISDALAARFRSPGAPVRPTAPAPTAPVSPTPTAPTPSRKDVLAESVIGPAGGRLQAAGAVSVDVPAGAIGRDERLSVRGAAAPALKGTFFEFEREDKAAFFARPVKISLAVPSGVDDRALLAVEKMGEGIFSVLPSRYDKAARTLSFETIHFSIKGFLSGFDSGDLRKLASGAGGFVATGAIVVAITGSSVITLPVLGIMAGGSILAGVTELFNPLIDAAYKWGYGLNRTIAFDPGLTISWVEDEKSSSHLRGAAKLFCVDISSKKILFAMDDPGLTPEKRAAAMTALFPMARVTLVQVPEAVIRLAADIQWTRAYFEGNGYPCPPTMDVWIRSMDACGSWDGTKLNIDVDYAQSSTAWRRAAMRVTLAHEYWHAVYGFNKYAPPFTWLDECLAVTFEGEVLPEAKKYFENTAEALDLTPEAAKKLNLGSQEGLPDSEKFYVRNTPAEFAVSLLTGFVLYGSEGTDEHKIQRGYKLWPWGKFMIHSQGHPNIRSLLKGETDGKGQAALFVQFVRALLTKDQELAEDVETSVESMGKERTYLTKSGWPKLTLSALQSNSVIAPGSSSSAISTGVLLSPRPLSMLLTRFAGKATGLAAPIVVRRKKPEPMEEVIALHPTRRDAKTGRRAFDDLEIGRGAAVIPPDWYDKRKGAAVEVPVAFVGKATAQTWAEYFGYGTANPVWAYFLSPPEGLKIVGSAAGKIQLAWDPPATGPGLEPKLLYAGYRLYTQKGKDAPVGIKDILLPAAEKRGEVAVDKLGTYDRIGLASEDLEMKDAEGKPLESSIGWMEVVKAEVTGYVSKPNPDHGQNPFSDEPLAVPVPGATVVCEFTENGRLKSLSAVTDGKGQVRFEVPLDIPITLKWGQEKGTVTCTAAAPKQVVGLGGVKLKTVSTEPIKKTP